MLAKVVTAEVVARVVAAEVVGATVVVDEVLSSSSSFNASEIAYPPAAPI